LKSPYEVLGVSEYANEDQIKQAYKDLARKYSDEKYSSGPLAGIAQKKMQELNDAYDAVVLNRSSVTGTSNTQSRSDTSGRNSNSQYNRRPQSEYNDIRTTIQNGRIDDAETLLDGIPPITRDAEWYYLKGTVHHRRGWLEEAVKNFNTACNMDPGNDEYRAALNNLNNSRNGGYKTPRNSNNGCSGCDVCTGLLCADCCCECFGGDIIPCC